MRTPVTHRSTQGFTVYQLLVSLVVAVIIASLGLAYQQSQKARPTTTTKAALSHG